MKRRSFIKKTALATAGSFVAPYVLPSGRLFAASGARLANHVVYVLYAGGVRNQEAVYQQYLAEQGGPSGNIMPNMFNGFEPGSSVIYEKWGAKITEPLENQAFLYNEMRYAFGPTGHYNGHTVAMTGRYTETGLNLNINPEYPTIFEYYRKHSDPAVSAKNAWWISAGLGPYPSLNYSRHPEYGALYGANFINPASFHFTGQTYLQDAVPFHIDDEVPRIDKMRNFLNNSFEGSAASPGITNTRNDREEIKALVKELSLNSATLDMPVHPQFNTAANRRNGDLINMGVAWRVLDEFKPELTVVNMQSSDICHSDFTAYVDRLHKADYAVGWLWDKIQSDPVLANDTIMIVVPEHGRNADPNSLFDQNGLRGYDHTSDDNSRKIFSMIAGPAGVVDQAKRASNNGGSPVGETIDIVPTIAHILGFLPDIPAGMLPGRVLNEAFNA